MDSGSSDGTLRIAHEQADRVVELAAACFSFGRALNMGAAVARAPIHFALSSHSFPPDAYWIERSIAKYDRPDVAGTSGAPTVPGSNEPLRTTFYQTLSRAINHPEGPWFSNTGSSWRAEVWSAFPFDEELAACEDKEWGLRVLAAGWTIAVDSTLAVSQAHRRSQGMRQLYQRTHREFAAIGSFVPQRRYTIAALLREWWTELPSAPPRHSWRARLSYLRAAELLGKYSGLRDSTDVTPSRDAAYDHARPRPSTLDGTADDA